MENTRMRDTEPGPAESYRDHIRPPINTVTVQQVFTNFTIPCRKLNLLFQALWPQTDLAYILLSILEFQSLL